MTKSRFLIVILLIAVIVIASIILLNDNEINNKNDSQINIITTFYPLQLIVNNLIKDVKDVNNINISASVGGCVHDYEMTPNDMMLIESADLIVINGQGMEPFMDKVSVNTHILDTSINIPNRNISSHIWLDFDNYIAQIKAVGEALIQIDKENQEKYTTNMEEYMQKINDLKNSINIRSQENVVIMHDAFKYYSNMGMFNIVEEFFAGHEGNYSANDIRNVIENVNGKNVRILFVDNETYEHNEELIQTIKNETDVNVYVLDLCVDVSGDLDRYIHVMENNMKIIEEAVKYVE